MVEDASIAPKLKRAPAAMTMHHAYIGGLLEHVVSLIDLSRLVASHYPELNRDLLLAGVVLHDIGKIEELSCARGFGYTTEGQLLGHIALGQAIVRRKIDAISEFPRPLATVIEHLILSASRASYEFGSPKLPLTREAVVLHFLDDLDSKMAAIETTMAVRCRQRRLDRAKSRAAPELAAHLAISGRAVAETGVKACERESPLL